MYTLKPPFTTNCFQCQEKIMVKFCPPQQNYSNKNHWGYWTDQAENKGKYICDSCLIDLYRNQKQTYLNSITDSKKRQTFRAYFGGKVGPLTRTQQKELARSELHNMLRRKGINLDEDELGDYLESWRQTVLKLVQENSRQAKKIRDLEKKVAKKRKKG